MRTKETKKPNCYVKHRHLLEDLPQSSHNCAALLRVSAYFKFHNNNLFWITFAALIAKFEKRITTGQVARNIPVKLCLC